MKNILRLTIVSLILFGCKSYVQVFDTDSTIQTNKDGFYIYENDSLKITYSFWKNKGLMTFSIYNKMNKPLYIDWKKSSYVANSVKLNYWIDEEKNQTFSSYGSYFDNGPLLRPSYAVSATAGASITSKVKVERITFIPPASYYYRSQFFILPISFYKIDTKSGFEEVPRNDKPKKMTKVYKADFTKENSPLVFRNFLTFSTTENSETEFYIDNEFYIDEVLEMDRRHFEQLRRDYTRKVGKWYISDASGNQILFTEFKKHTSFYLRIPDDRSIKHRR